MQMDNSMKRKIINSVIKETITFIQSSDETNGGISELELPLMAKGGAIFHTAIRHLQNGYRRIVGIKRFLQ
jgi:hypothetical protein